MKVGIVGLGHVGSAMHELFTQAVLYDEPKEIGTRGEINACDVAFLCVPTPMKEDGSCDTSAVDYCISWMTPGTIVIRSTVPVGYTRKKAGETGKRIVFQPEYYGETPNHPLADLRKRTWITLGGDAESIEEVRRAYETVYNSTVEVRVSDSDTAELAKYMENAFLAAKVTFFNEFYEIAQAMHVDYDKAKELFLMDPRMNRSHTAVYKDDRGYGGSCLPKDMASIIYQAEQLGADCGLLRSIRDRNSRFRELNRK